MARTPRSSSRVLALFGAGALALTLAACSSGTDTSSTTTPAATGATSAAATGGSPDAGTSPAAGGGANIAAIVKGLDNPFFQTMQDGIEQAAAETGSTVSVQAATSITDTAGQADKLNSLVGQDFDCFVVNPISGTNLIQGVAQAAAKGVPIVNIDSPIDAEAAKAANATIATYIGTDNVEAGKLGGQTMGELLPDGGSVALIGGISGDVTSGNRLDGFQQGIPSNVTVV